MHKLRLLTATDREIPSYEKYIIMIASGFYSGKCKQVPFYEV